MLRHRKAVPVIAAPAYLLADAQAQADDLSGARYHLSEGLRLDPDHGLASIAATRIFIADESLAARRRLIDHIQRQAPGERRAAQRASSGQAADATVALLLGDLNAMTDDMDRAAHWHRQVLAQVPSQPTALNNLAVILTDSDPRQAVQLTERALQQAPQDPDVLDTLGTALLAAGDSARARELLNRAYALSNQRPVNGLNLARVLAADGEPDHAREVLRVVVRQELPQQGEALDFPAALQRLRGRSPSTSAPESIRTCTGHRA